jgi:hypothetical protein
LQVKPRVHSASGSVFAVTLPQVPFDPPVFAAVHALHAPVQVVSQQTLSMQFPLVHCVPSVHAVPFAWPPPATHALLVHV